MVDEQECLGVIDQIKLAVPDELQTARRVMAERERILAEADERANRLVAPAEDRPLTDRRPRSRPRCGRPRPRDGRPSAARGQRMRRQVDAYAERELSSLQSRLRRMEQAVQKGLDDLRDDE